MATLEELKARLRLCLYFSMLGLIVSSCDDNSNYSNTDRSGKINEKNNTPSNYQEADYFTSSEKEVIILDPNILGGWDDEEMTFSYVFQGEYQLPNGKMKKGWVCDLLLIDRNNTEDKSINLTAGVGSVFKINKYSFKVVYIFKGTREKQAQVKIKLLS